MNYNDYILSTQTMLMVPTNNTDINFQNFIPRMIELAEQRIYRELDFLCTLASQTTLLTASTRIVALPSNIVVCQSANVITPSSTTNPDLGTRNGLQRVGLDYVNAVYPSVSGATLPKVYAEIGNPTIVGSTITASAINIVLGPAPDAAYTIELIGTVRPTALSPANQNTFLTTYLPDLFMAASMKAGADYFQDAELGGIWENAYKTAFASTNFEELRKKSASVNWTPYQVNPVANVPRERNAA